MGAALCLDVMKLLWIVVILNVRGGFSERIGIPTEFIEVASLFLYGVGVIGAFHFLRLVWRCFFPKTSSAPACRCPPREEPPPETKACGVPVRPRGPRPLMAHALAT